MHALCLQLQGRCLQEGREEVGVLRELNHAGQVVVFPRSQQLVVEALVQNGGPPKVTVILLDGELQLSPLLPDVVVHLHDHLLLVSNKESFVLKLEASDFPGADVVLEDSVRGDALDPPHRNVLVLEDEVRLPLGAGHLRFCDVDGLVGVIKIFEGLHLDFLVAKRKPRIIFQDAAHYVVMLDAPVIKLLAYYPEEIKDPYSLVQSYL